MAEDSPGDAELMRIAVQRCGVAACLTIVEDGELAIAYLQGETPYDDRSRFPLPRLIFLDIKMPRRDGFEVLQWIRERPELAALPVLMLSTSNQTSDKERARQLGANAYYVKPTEFNDLVRLVQTVFTEWFKN